MEELKGWSQFKHYTINNLGDQHYFREHQDAPEDTFALLLLSEPGKDYDGGLIIHGQRLPWNTETLCVDSRMSCGDLLIFDGHRHRHEVRITSNQDHSPGRYKRQGRKLYFVNLKPYQDWYKHHH